MKEDRLYLIHIEESLDKIHEYIAGLDFPDFIQKSLVQDAVLRNLQVLAESTQRLSADFKEAPTTISVLIWKRFGSLLRITY